MKKTIGILLIIIVILGMALLGLALWDVTIISWSMVWKILATVGVVLITILLVAIFKSLFLRREKAERNSGNVAHRIN